MNKDFEQLKREFIKKGLELLDYMYENNKNFDDKTYPEYLPSFDEFLCDLELLEEVDE